MKESGTASRQSSFLVSLKEKFVCLHIKPYNMDIYNHIKCSAALLTNCAVFRVGIIADVTASMCTQLIP